MAFLQDIIHCAEHCMSEIREDWFCGMEETGEEHTEHHTKGCYFGTSFEISDEEYEKLPEK